MEKFWKQSIGRTSNDENENNEWKNILRIRIEMSVCARDHAI